MAQPLAGVFVGIDFQIGQPAEGSQVVDTPYMVVVNVRYQNAINLFVRHRKYLLAEVGAAIYQYACGFGLKQCRRAQSFILGIGALAHLACTANDGYSVRSPGT